MFGIQSVIFISAIAVTFSFGEVDAVRIADYPYKVVIKVFETSHACGGVLLSPEHVLTSTNCLKKNGRFTTLFTLSTYKVTPFDATLTNGTTHLAWRYVNEYEVSWEDNPTLTPISVELNGNITILKLFQKIEATTQRKHAFLPTHDSIVNEKLRALGYGFEYNPEVGPKNDQLNNFTIAEFRISKKDEFKGTVTIDRSEEISALDPKDNFCYGYSGDPLINSEKEIVGIMINSWNCASNTSYEFINIHPYKDWIKKALKRVVP